MGITGRLKKNSMVDHGLEDQGRLVLGEDQVVDSGNVTDWNVDDNRGLNGPSGSTIDTTHGEKIITTYGLDGLEERLYYYMKSELNKTKLARARYAVCSDGNVGQIGPYNPFEGMGDNKLRLIEGDRSEDRFHKDESHEDKGYGDAVMTTRPMRLMKPPMLVRLMKQSTMMWTTQAITMQKRQV